MTLTAGTRLGPYEVIAAIGAGGMGEVYRARDTKLNRDVALKILPEAFTSDADRLARFRREAQVLASLNHPNIASIYGMEGDGPGSPPGEARSLALVMELVEGRDLSEIIASQDPALHLREVIALARQIIDALEAAHEQGIIHRDLKPQNIKVRDDGTVKVLDFGLAKAMDPAGGAGGDSANSPTLTARATQMGMILGTAAYMSPEQARGRAVDKRTDVWAFGCVLYEMLSGKKAFDGEDATEIISAVVKTEPDWTALPASAPEHVRMIVTRCLVKDRKARIPDISVVRFMLDDSLTAPVPATTMLAPPRSSSLIWKIATAALVLAILVVGGAWYRSTGVTAGVATFVIPPQENMVYTAGSRAGASVPVISPDGLSVAFTARDNAGKQLLWVRRIDSLTALPIAGTENAAFPFWSPDSRSIGYAITGQLLRVVVAGGVPQKVCDLNPGIIARGGSWNRDGVIIFNNGPAPLYRVQASGGEAVVMGELPDSEGGRQFPAFLPDGRHYLYSASGSKEKGGVFVASLDGGASTRVVSAETGAVYDTRSGRLLFVRHGTLLAQAFDLKTFAVSGDPLMIAEHVESASVGGLVAFSVSETGVLAYGIGESAESDFQLTWVDRTGKTVGTVGPAGPYRGVSLSPDGRQVAVHRHEGDGGDIWLIDVARGTPSRFTFDAQENASPVWSPNGSRIAYSSIRDGKPGLYVKALNNTGEEERLFETSATETSATRFLVAFSWSVDERSILFGMPGLKTSNDIWSLPMTGDRKAVPLLQSPFSEGHGQLSPDGRWLAYMSNEARTQQIIVRSTSAGGGKWVVANGGGAAPRWRGDSGELFYIGNGKMWAVALTTKGAELVPDSPKALFDQSGIDNASGHNPYFSYAVDKSGQRLLMSRRLIGGDGAPGKATIVVVVNWSEGIKK